MRQSAAIKKTEMIGAKWKLIAREQLQDAANTLLEEAGSAVRVYSDKALARKMRLEDKRLPNVDETATPNIAAEYLLQRQIELLVDSARLSKLQGAVLSLVLQGWRLADISLEFDIPPQNIWKLLQIAWKRICTRNAPYLGLYEVYWKEVNRYIYRKHHTQR